MNNKYYNIDLYHWHLSVYIGTPKEITEQYSKLTGNTDTELIVGGRTTSKGVNTYVFVATGNSTNIMVHELFHAVEYIMDGCGIPYEPDVTSEVWAYLLDHIYKRVVLLEDGKEIN